jgi:hypothetical protein
MIKKEIERENADVKIFSIIELCHYDFIDRFDNVKIYT